MADALTKIVPRNSGEYRSDHPDGSAWSDGVLVEGMCSEEIRRPTPSSGWWCMVCWTIRVFRFRARQTVHSERTSERYSALLDWSDSSGRKSMHTVSLWKLRASSTGDL